MSSKSDSRRCSELTKAGEPCRAFAVRGTQRCAAHSRDVGAPVGNQNRLTHGFYVRPSPSGKLKNLDGVIDDLIFRQEQLSAYIDEQMAEGIEVDDVLKLMSLQGQIASRLGRLKRDQRALSGESADGMFEMMSKLLDEINTEMNLGVTL